MASGRKRRLSAKWLVACLLVAAVSVGVWFGFTPLARAMGWLVDGGSPTISPTVFTSPSAVPDEGAAQGAPQPALSDAQLDPATLKALVSDLSTEGAGVTTWTVLDASSGDVLTGSKASKALIPASTMKLMTALTLAEQVPLDERVATKVVQVSDGKIVLVGGGDPLLMSDPKEAEVPQFASLKELAQLTAAALQKSGATKVELGFDTSLFTGPSWTSRWEDVFRPLMSPVTALTVDHGYAKDALVPSTDPATMTAKRFASMLKTEGISVKFTGKESGDSGTEVAQVESATMADLMRYSLLHSDNTGTEIMLRHAALAAGNPGSFEGAWKTLRATIKELGLWEDGMVVSDGSGVSRDNRVTATVLANAVRLIVTDEQFQPLMDGLPVAAATGTLQDRFDDGSARAGRGLIHAKTGTLRDVSTLAGFTTTKDGQLLVFAFMSNEYTNYTLTANWIDNATSILAGCGCK